MSAARTGKTPTTLYVLDTNVLLHDPNALLNFQEHQVAIPMTVLEELDQLKAGKHSVAAECRQAIRLIDQVLGAATPQEVEQGVVAGGLQHPPKLPQNRPICSFSRNLSTTLQFPPESCYIEPITTVKVDDNERTP